MVHLHLSCVRLNKSDDKNATDDDYASIKS